MTDTEIIEYCIVPSCSKMGQFLNSRTDDSGEKIFGLMCHRHDNFFGILNLEIFARMSPDEARDFNAKLISGRI